MNKTAIKNKLIQMQQCLIQEFEEKMNLTHTMVDMDEEDVREPEDFSHQYEAGEMEHLFRIQLNRAKGKLQEIESISTEPASAVDKGAVVETDLRNFIVGHSTVPFWVKGKEFVGISKSAPIYAVMAGKCKGETFSFCGVDYQINNIY